MKKRTILGVGIMVAAAILCVALGIWNDKPQDVTPGSYTPGTYEASAQGCLSAVKVTVTVDESKITDLDIDASGETPDLGGAAAETLAQAILEANSADVDSVTGSTMTSEAVKEAVSKALALARGEEVPAPSVEPTPEATPEPTPEPTPEVTPEPTPESTPEATPEPSEEPAPSAEPTKAPEETKTPEATKAPETTPTPEATPEPTPEPAAGIYNPGTYTGTGAGFGGDVIVTITVDDNNITSVTVTGDSETAAIGGAALGTLADQIKAAQSAGIDGVSGASVTSGAAKDAAAEALGKAKR